MTLGIVVEMGSNDAETGMEQERLWGRNFLPPEFPEVKLGVQSAYRSAILKEL